MIFVSLENWDEIWRRNQFLCAQFALENPTRQMLFVGPAKDISHSVKSGDWQRILAPGIWKLREFPNLTILTPLKFLPNSWRLGRWFNETVSRWQIRQASRRLQLQSPVLWLNPHSAVHMVGRLGESTVVYDITDDWTELTQDEELAALTRAQDAELCRRADAVIVCSERLRELKQELAGGRLHHIPNGVDAAHYRQVLQGEGPLPPPSDTWQAPVIGYTGTVHPDRVDVPLLAELAAEMPEATFVLIGPNMLESEDRERLASRGNVQLTGALPYARLPETMRAFSVCMVPHRVTPFTESLNPIKLWEYLAAGKPIVSTPVAGFRDYPQWVRLASGAREFAAALREALREDPAVPLARQAEAAHHSWESRWAQVRQVLETCLMSAKPHNIVSVDLSQRSAARGLLSLLAADARLLTREFKRPWKKRLVALGNSGLHAVLCYRLAHWFVSRRIPILPAVFNKVAQHLFAVDIDPLARIGPGLVLVHCFGTVIGSGVEIDGDCIIYHGVTLGNRGSEWVGSERTDGHPHVEPGCIFGAGAKVLGPIRVGRNCVVGANAVVLQSIPPSSVAAGIPARVVATRPEMDENLRPVQPPGSRVKWANA